MSSRLDAATSPVFLGSPVTVDHPGIEASTSTPSHHNITSENEPAYPIIPDPDTSNSGLHQQSNQVEPIPKAPNVRDELHPSTNPSHSIPTDPEDRRTIENIVENEKQGVIAETTVPAGGMFLPSTTGAMGPIPGLPSIIPDKILAAAHLDPITSPSEKPHLHNTPSNTNTSSSSTSQSNSNSKPPHPTATTKKSLNPFSKSRKNNEIQTKKFKQKEEEANALPPVGMLALFRFSTPYERFLNILGLLLAAAAGATQPLMTLIFGRLTNSFTQFAVIANGIAQTGVTAQALGELENARRQLKVDSGHNALYLMAIGIGMFICTWLYMYIYTYTGELNAKRVREKYLQAVLKQEIAYFDDLGAGEVATRIQTDCHLIQQGTSEKVALIIQYLSTFITGFALAYARSWRLALAMSSLLPVIAITGGVMMAIMTKWTALSLESTAKAGTLAEEVIASIRTIHAFGTAKVLGKKFDEHIATMQMAGNKTSIVEGGGLGVIFFSIYAAYGLAFFYGGILVAQGHANVGIVINVFMSILIGSFSMAMLTPELQSVTKARGAAAKLFATIDRKPLIDSSDPGGLKPEAVDGRITFEGVKFHYPSRPNVPILKGLTTTFPAGQTIALVGSSGSGKSTVVSLVERFYDPIEGVIKLDGRDIKSLNLKWLRQQIGLVSQEPTLFGTTVRGNVEHGLIGSRWENASEDEKLELVKKACVDANAHDFIMKLPNGYETHVGERGMLLSGGQKQRVAIARAIVSDPRILLLDEATSALDTQSEGIVQDALDKASKGRTTITIAHRLSTIRDADCILVMGGGEILEQGTHNDLLANENGPYAQLVFNQKLAAETQKIESADSDSLSDYSDEITSKTHAPKADSPLREKFPEMKRALTGRSVASAAMDDIKARQAADQADEDRIPSAWKQYARLLKLNKADWNLYALGTVAAIASGMVYPAMAILFGRALTDFQIQDFDELKRSLNRKALWYFITAIAAGIAIFIQSFCFSRTGWNLTAKLRSMTFAAVLRHDIEWFDQEKRSTGAVTSDLSDLPERVKGLWGPTVGSLIQSLATLAGGAIIGLSFGPLLALIGIACIPLLVSGGYLRLKVVVLKDRRMKKIHEASAHLASEAAASVRTVAALTREDDMDRIYSQALEGPLKIAVRGSIWSQALYAASQGLSFCIIALVFYIGSLWIISGRYSTSQFFTVLTSVVFAAIQAGNVFSFVPDASKANNATASIFRLLDDEAVIDSLSDGGIHLDPSQVQGHIRIEGVHFRYPSRPSVRVLRELDIDVPPGTYVALVGPSGCGKSTTVQMLERFYDPLAGRVTIDGIDIKALNVASYRQNVALVSQEPTLYAGTVRFNVLLGASKPASEVTEEEVIAACKNANIYDFIMSLPDGFDTEVGGKGSQLSGGQKQRIAIARALIRNPKVLLLDEATSALDSQSEKVVQDALDRAAKGRTTIAIAHRLSTIQKADIIYCFAEGKVAEKGTHQELLAKRGAYFELVQMQNLSRQ